MNIEELKRLAKQATQGGWRIEESGDMYDSYAGKRRLLGNAPYSEYAPDIEDARYIVVANPQVILELIAMVERQEARIKELESTDGTNAR
tara:strand:- start:1381 stop:1650 length:270 start_codon:yes stop_codon:yes gene_type:complete